MKITKAASVELSGAPSAEQLEKINRLTKKAVTAEEVYVFSVRLCDDQVDRDDERFSESCIRELAALFIGKTGVMDHVWSAEKQVARIFDTEVLAENGATYLACEHVKGETYGAERCAAVVCEAVDAYEFSFVAVPAQKQAGVLQKQTGGGVPVDEFALKKLQMDAELGKAYRQELETRVTRAALLLGLELDAGLMKRIVRGMAAEELKGLSEGLERRTAELFAPEPQMTVEQDAAREQNSAFLI